MGICQKMSALGQPRFPAKSKTWRWCRTEGRRLRRGRVPLGAQTAWLPSARCCATRWTDMRTRRGSRTSRSSSAASASTSVPCLEQIRSSAAAAAAVMRLRRKSARSSASSDRTSWTPSAQRFWRPRSGLRHGTRMMPGRAAPSPTLAAGRMRAALEARRRRGVPHPSSPRHSFPSSSPLSTPPQSSGSRKSPTPFPSCSPRSPKRPSGARCARWRSLRTGDGTSRLRRWRTPLPSRLQPRLRRKPQARPQPLPTPLTRRLRRRPPTPKAATQRSSTASSLPRRRGRNIRLPQPRRTRHRATSR
mmetsp:Transcript_26375/g.86541  ORF Transcript_26375/g.86541 Transcript_26375/m.86541 type:complete len:304 (+) Transcript_26375:2420-3331(+)